MKKKLIFIMVSVIVLFTICSGVFADESIIVKIDGQQIVFDVQPQLINGRTMVPMRKIFESLGASVAWDDATQTITSTKGKDVIVLSIGQPNIKINEQIPKELDVAPCLVGGRTLVPVRAISEALHMNVNWDGETQTVLITSPNVNIVNYNKLKNIIINQGEKTDGGGMNDYNIFYQPEKNYSLLIGYTEFEQYEDITLFFTFKYEDGKDTTMVNIYNDQNPTAYLSGEYDFDEYSAMYSFPVCGQLYEKNWNDFPEYVDVEEHMNLGLEFIDILLKQKVGMTLSDFGIHYVSEL